LLPDYQIANGSLHEQKVRCGKSNCRCAKGKLHARYFYFFTRYNGKLRKIYIPKNQVESFSKKLEEATRLTRDYREFVKSSNDLIKEFRASLRENDRLSVSRKNDLETFYEKN
jgi:hypothetical protein